MNTTETLQEPVPHGRNKPRKQRRYTAKQRASLIQRYKASGKTGRQFSEEQGISSKTLYGWLKASRSKAATFAKVELPSSRAGAIELRLGNGVCVTVDCQGSRDDVIALVRGIAGC